MRLEVDDEEEHERGGHVSASGRVSLTDKAGWTSSVAIENIPEVIAAQHPSVVCATSSTFHTMVVPIESFVVDGRGLDLSQIAAMTIGGNIGVVAIDDLEIR